jgi:putative hydrolase of the HAD superfamily
VNVRCVVFDVDDTLYLERDYVRSGFAAVGAMVRGRWAVEGFADRAWRLFEAGERGNIFDRALAECALAGGPDVIESLVACYREHRPAIRLHDDARACLDRLVRRFAIAGLTDGPSQSQHAKVDALGLAVWLTPIVITGDLGPGRGKPDPAGFRLIEETTGAHGGSCVYVADNPDKDFIAPRLLGWRTVRIRRPGGLHALRPSGDDVDREIETLDAVESSW